ncbi:MAG: DEAD/DEAH box helicase family protein [Candidatus Peribacter sp.]|nr:DEAD/DEAH box helicase family protein [Candidatus Peribacter sp.]
MRIELKSFQEIAARDLLQEIAFARKEVRLRKPQAIVLSSPTGSGKTVIVTQLLEWIWQGDDENEGDKNAVFLWLSDSPELNAQSRDKIVQQSSVFSESNLIIIESPFSEERLQQGNIYFLNTQKLSKSSLLTKTGDGRDYTIWQTIENTVREHPEHVYLVIDEAHRGMAEDRDRKTANSIMQRFIKGYPEGGMSPVPLVIGMSATPERFEKLIEGANRTKRQHAINPDDVKLSGLLKEKIILFHPEDERPADWSLLGLAAKRWKEYSAKWQKYCREQNMEQIVEPVLVIQVEDGTAKQLSKTNLDEVVKIVERTVGKLPEAAWAHAFQEDSMVEAGGRKIRKIEASKIENDRAARIVLFKMSLTTGWDCPRAEVMMSFRRAVDHTLIAQLVGRMVRTPLARKVEGNEVLNTVSLVLPHYNAEGLGRIINALNNPDPESGLSVEVADASELVSVSIDPKLQKCVECYQNLPSYRIERVPKMSNIRRLVRFARYLSMDEIDLEALDGVKTLIVQTLEKELARCKKSKKFVGNVSANEEIEVVETWVKYGEDDPEAKKKTVTIKATEENVEDLFARCGRTLGEGLDMEYWRARQGNDQLQTKLELIGLLMEDETIDVLEKVCGEQLEALQRKYDGAIRKLGSASREHYNILKRIAKEPEAENLLLPSEMEISKEGMPWSKHLYVEKNGIFEADLNTWESRVVEKLIKEDRTVVAWLRVLPRKDWAFCIPYDKDNEKRPLFPDIVAFRKVKGKIVADIMDPHGTHIDDAVEKARGLSAYARKHGHDFGRIDLIVINKKDQLKRLNFNEERVRDRVDRVRSREHLEEIIEDMG